MPNQFEEWLEILDGHRAMVSLLAMLQIREN